MLDDFVVRAGLAGLGVALAAGPLGCIVLWRRLAYMGDTLAHAGLLGAAIALLSDIAVPVVVLLVCLAVALALRWLSRDGMLASDAALGLIAHAALAAGLFVIALQGGVRVDLDALLFGDVLAVTRGDLVLIGLGSTGVLLALAVSWRWLFAAAVSPELAAAEGVPVGRLDWLLPLMIAALVAIAMKVVGALMISALLLMPAAAARRLAGGPESMAALAALFGALAVIGGLALSMTLDTPAGPSVVVAASGLFVIALLAGRLRG